MKAKDSLLLGGLALGVGFIAYRWGLPAVGDVFGNLVAAPVTWINEQIYQPIIGADDPHGTGMGRPELHNYDAKYDATGSVPPVVVGVAANRARMGTVYVDRSLPPARSGKWSDFGATVRLWNRSTFPSPGFRASDFSRPSSGGELVGHPAALCALVAACAYSGVTDLYHVGMYVPKGKTWNGHRIGRAVDLCNFPQAGEIYRFFKGHAAAKNGSDFDFNWIGSEDQYMSIRSGVGHIASPDVKEPGHSQNHCHAELPCSSGWITWGLGQGFVKVVK